MYKMRRISKFYMIPLVCLSVIYLLIVILPGEPKEDTDNKYKLEIIDKAIRSNANNASCQIPFLPVYSPEMMAFVHDESLIDCGDGEDWVYCNGSICTIKKSIADKLGEVICIFRDIIRTDDYTIQFGRMHQSNEQYTLIDSDFVKVHCWTLHSGGSKYWSAILSGIRVRHNDNHIRNNIPNKSLEYPNVLMFGLDSLSRNAFIRKLPRSYKYLVKDLNADILQGYNIVGDGTPQALIPILTGFTELELPETRKRMKDTNFVNVYPMIWKKYHESGYMTAFNEDLPNVGTFTYRLNGFNEQPTDHYMRTYYLAIEPELGGYKKLCVGYRAKHKIMLDYTKQFMQSYTNDPRFVFSFHGELSHDSINLVGVADNDLLYWMKSLKNEGILNNTILIIMSDHGNRFAQVRDTLQGKLEERLPFFSFVFPTWFKEKYKIQYNNFQENLNRLTTPFDVHATLEEILCNYCPIKVFDSNFSLKQNNNLNKSKNLQNPPAPSMQSVKSKRAISLFRKIPSNRTCADAYIEPHWCSCLNWHPIANVQTEPILGAAFAIVDKINSLTSQYRHLCSPLYLHEIKWAAKLAPHDNLLRFKQNKDFDGFLADLTSTTLVTSELYQVKLTVKPGKSIFEASVLHDLKMNQFKVNSSDISRVNQYGNQAVCIMDLNPEIRKYCFCKKQSNDT